MKDYHDSLQADNGRRETASASPNSGNAPQAPNRISTERIIDFDHAASLVREGEVLLAEGKVAEARQAFRHSFEIAYRLCDSDRTNVVWAGELGVINDRLGDVEKITGAPYTAQKIYEESLKVQQKLTVRSCALRDISMLRASEFSKVWPSLQTGRRRVPKTPPASSTSRRVMSNWAKHEMQARHLRRQTRRSSRAGKFAKLRPRWNRAIPLRSAMWQ